MEKVFIANGYPKKKVKEIIKERSNEKEKKMKDDEGKHVLLLVLPCIQGLSEKVSKTCHKINIKTALAACPTLRNLLVKVKDQPLDWALSHAAMVHVYIGERGRCLDVIIIEHKRAVFHLDQKKAIVVHVAQCMDHKILMEKSTIKQFETNWLRRIKEAIWVANVIYLEHDSARKNRGKGVETSGQGVINKISLRENTGIGSVTGPSMDKQ